MMEEKHILTRQTVLLRWYIFKLRHTQYSFDRFRFVSVVKRHWPPSYSQLTNNSLHIKVLFLNSIWHRIYNDEFAYIGQKGKNKQKMHYLHSCKQFNKITIVLRNSYEQLFWYTDINLIEFAFQKTNTQFMHFTCK